MHFASYQSPIRLRGNSVFRVDFGFDELTGKLLECLKDFFVITQFIASFGELRLQG